MPVYNIEWNTFIPDIFITCAAEWVIKIWDKGVRYTLIIDIQCCMSLYSANHCSHLTWACK